MKTQGKGNLKESRFLEEKKYGPPWHKPALSLSFSSSVKEDLPLYISCWLSVYSWNQCLPNIHSKSITPLETVMTKSVFNIQEINCWGRLFSSRDGHEGREEAKKCYTFYKICFTLGGRLCSLSLCLLSLPRSSSRIVLNTTNKKALLSSNSCILGLRLDSAIFSREVEHGHSYNIPNSAHFFPP